MTSVPEGHRARGHRATVMAAFTVVCLLGFSLAGEPLPSGVAPVPDGISWTVRIESEHQKENVGSQSAELESDAAGFSATEARRITNEYAEGIRKVVYYFGRGATQTVFLVGNQVIQKHPRRKDPIVLGRDEALMQGLPYAPGQFHEFHWVSSKNFVGTRTFQGVRCDVYQQTLYDAPRGLFDAPESAIPQGEHLNSGTNDLPRDVVDRMTKSIFRTAYIDHSTRLPVALEDGLGLHRYEFRPLDSPLVLPAEFTKALDETRLLREKARKRYAIPQ